MKTKSKFACILTAICGIMMILCALILIIIPGLVIGDTIVLILGIVTTVSAFSAKNIKV